MEELLNSTSVEKLLVVYCFLGREKKVFKKGVIPGSQPCSSGWAYT